MNDRLNDCDTPSSGKNLDTSGKALTAFDGPGEQLTDSLSNAQAGPELPSLWVHADGFGISGQVGTLNRSVFSSETTVYETTACCSHAPFLACAF